MKTSDDQLGMSVYEFSTASPPTGGTCSITPSSGISLKTDFNLSCSGWKSDSIPLSYLIQYQLKTGFYNVLYKGVNSSIISLLPPGKLPDYAVKIIVTVTDTYGASAPPVNLSVQVICITLQMYFMMP